jgi:phosphoribosylamine--glycine ligase
MKLFEKAGIEVPPYKTFPTLAAAEAHVRKTGERYVFKTLGDEEDKSLSYVGKSPADMIARLQRWTKLGMNPKGPVMLQTFVPGVEIGVSRWMGRDGWVGTWNENFEFKKFLSGNCGPNCGEAGTLMKYTDESKLAEDVLAPLEKALMDMKHLGDIDVNVIVSEKDGKPMPLEFTTRLGWPAANIMWASHGGDPVEWMLDACNGKDTLKTSMKVACGIVVAQPDYPYSKATKAETEGIPIYGVTKQNQAYLSPQSVRVGPMPMMKGTDVVEGPCWTTTGDYVCVVSGLGSSVKRATERAYKTVKELHIPDMIYRDDIGEKLEKEIPALQAHGFATDWRYE